MDCVELGSFRKNRFYRLDLFSACSSFRPEQIDVNYRNGALSYDPPTPEGTTSAKMLASMD